MASATGSEQKNKSKKFGVKNSDKSVSTMATGGGGTRTSKVTKERCVFCDKLEIQQNMKRHVTQFCETARAECDGKDVLKELERRKAKRKGLIDVKTMFQTKQKSARTENVGTDTEHRGEELLMEDEEMNTDEMNNQNVDLNEIEDLETATNIGDHEPNIDPMDQRILEKLEKMNIGMGEGFQSVLERLDTLGATARKEIPLIAKPEDVEADDDRLWDLRKCSSLDDILQLFDEFNLEYEDGVPFLYCSLCCPEGSIYNGARHPGIFHLNGPACDDNGKMTPAFSNLKSVIKNHTKTRCHIKKLDLWRAKEEENEREDSKNHAAGMRLARIALVGYQKGRSGPDFEEQVLLGEF